MTEGKGKNRHAFNTKNIKHNPIFMKLDKCRFSVTILKVFPAKCFLIYKKWLKSFQHPSMFIQEPTEVMC